MNRHSNREKAMVVVYQNLIFQRDIDELINDNLTTDEEKADQYILDVIHKSVENADRYAGYINQVLDGWTFDRLGTIEQAILLNGCAEFDLKQVQAAIIIDEYVEFAKEYCDADSFKLVNGVLDRI